MKTRNRILLMLSLIVFISCQYDPYAHTYTTSEPKASELIGTYIFHKQTVDYDITEFKDAINGEIVVPKIKINANGTYEVINLPVFESFDPTYVGLISKTGNWEVLPVASIGNGSGEIKDHWGFHMPELPKDLRRVGLMNSKAPYGIIFGFGDPDTGQVMIFTKE